jgi:hypothetical protein
MRGRRARASSWCDWSSAASAPTWETRSRPKRSAGRCPKHVFGSNTCLSASPALAGPEWSASVPRAPRLDEAVRDLAVALNANRTAPESVLQAQLFLYLWNMLFILTRGGPATDKALLFGQGFPWSAATKKSCESVSKAIHTRFSVRYKVHFFS